MYQEHWYWSASPGLKQIRMLIEAPLAAETEAVLQLSRKIIKMVVGLPTRHCLNKHLHNTGALNELIELTMRTFFNLRLQMRRITVHKSIRATCTYIMIQPVLTTTPYLNRLLLTHCFLNVDFLLPC